jgi:hypothetical protein
MASVVTPDQVNDHLSSPRWSADQVKACEVLIAQRQKGLERWFGVPIDPVDRTETVAVLDSGLLATSWPVFRVYAIDSVTLADPGALLWEPLPDPYVWRDDGWISLADPVSQSAYTERSYSIIGGSCAVLPRVTVRYAGGWGPQPDIMGALIEKVGNVMANRHEDTVTARQLDEHAPPPLKEEWTDKELLMLRSRRRVRGGRRL